MQHFEHIQIDTNIGIREFFLTRLDEFNFDFCKIDNQSLIFTYLRLSDFRILHIWRHRERPEAVDMDLTGMAARHAVNRKIPAHGFRPKEVAVFLPETENNPGNCGIPPSTK